MDSSTQSNAAYEGEQIPLKTDANISQSKRSVVTSFVALCLCCMLLNFASKTGLKLNENINIYGNVGIISSAIITGCTLVAGMFLPNPMIYILGYWWILFTFIITVLLYTSAIFMGKLSWINFVASGLLGLMTSPFETVKGSFITELSMNYAQITEQTTDIIIPRFFGIFNGIYQISGIGSGLAIHLIFSNHPLAKNTTHSSLCGAYFHAYKIRKSPDVFITQSTRMTAFGVCIGTVLIAGILLIFIKDKSSKHSASNDFRSIVFNIGHSLKATFRKMIELKQQLLVPLAFWIGFNQQYIEGLFYLAFVSCSLGIQSVGLVVFSYRIAQLLGCVICGYIVSYTGRWLCMALSTIAYYSLLVIMYRWYPTGDDETLAILVVISVFWGLAVACFNVTTNSIYGQLFSNESMSQTSTMVKKENATPTGFSNYSFWKALGAFCMAVLASLMIVKGILLILTFLLTISVVAFAILEYLLQKQQYTSF